MVNVEDSTSAPPVLNEVNGQAVAGLVAKIQEEPEVADSTWSASVRWKGGFRSESEIRGFGPIPSDEPVGLGGSDSAPNPVEQLLAALGNCLAVGYAANATASGITINDLTIDVDGDVNLKTFLGLDAEGNAGFQGIRVSVNLDSDADAHQLEALHRTVIATSPVGHTLQRPIPVAVATG